MMGDAERNNNRSDNNLRTLAKVCPADGPIRHTGSDGSLHESAVGRNHSADRRTRVRPRGTDGKGTP
jgi:hypothetical protein